MLLTAYPGQVLGPLRFANMLIIVTINKCYDLFGRLGLISASNQLLAFHCHEQPRGSTLSIPQAAAVVAMHAVLETLVCVTVYSFRGSAICETYCSIAESVPYISTLKSVYITRFLHFLAKRSGSAPLYS